MLFVMMSENHHGLSSKVSKKEEEETATANLLQNEKQF